MVHHLEKGTLWNGITLTASAVTPALTPIETLWPAAIGSLDKAMYQ